VAYEKANAVERSRSGDSLDRFVRAARRTQDFGKQARSESEAIDYAFGILANVAQPGYTQWSIVYDQKRGKIYFRTRKTPQIRSIDTTAFDYSCAAPVKILDMNTELAGDATHYFKNYTREANRDLVERAFNGTDFLRNVPAAARDAHASFPEKFACGSHSPLVNPETKQIATTVAGIGWLDLLFPIYYVYKHLVSS